MSVEKLDNTNAKGTRVLVEMFLYIPEGCPREHITIEKTSKFVEQVFQSNSIEGDTFQVKEAEYV